MTGCCNYMGSCDNCVRSGAYWFTLNNTESVAQCCCHDPHNQPGTIIKWAEYPSQCKAEEQSTQYGFILTASAVIVIVVLLIMAMIYLYKKGYVQRCLLRRGRGATDDLPLIRYDSVYDSEMTTVL